MESESDFFLIFYVVIFIAVKCPYRGLCSSYKAGDLRGYLHDFSALNFNTLQIAIRIHVL